MASIRSGIGERTMRLIDADKIIEHLEKVKKESASLVDMAHIIGFQSVIDTQPTAYDVDKVVEQLRKQQEKLETDIFAKESDNWYGQYCNGIHEGIDKAIEIVKAGGIDEKVNS